MKIPLPLTLSDKLSLDEQIPEDLVELSFEELMDIKVTSVAKRVYILHHQAHQKLGNFLKPLTEHWVKPSLELP